MDPLIKSMYCILKLKKNKIELLNNKYNTQN